MTAVDEPTLVTDTLDDEVLAAETTPVAPVAPDAPDGTEPDGGEPALDLARLTRRLLAAGFATLAAGLLIAGIFDSWAARGVALIAAALGPAWAGAAQRSARRVTLQLLLPPALLVLSLIIVGLLGGSPAELPTLISEALRGGREFRPPVPFDPGWGPLLLVAITMLGYAAAYIATAMDKPMIAVAIPLPVVALTAISQPDGSELLAGLFALVPILASLAMLFGGDTDRADGLGAEFELKRALRALAGTVPIVVLLVLMNSASFLFPEPRYDPSDEPQKPKAVPLSAAQDRVLFEVATESPLTGPWRTGVLDVYDGKAWRLPPHDTSRFEPLPADGSLTTLRATAPKLSATITVRDLGNSAVLPMIATSTRVSLTGADVVVDPRVAVLRVPEGRVPAGVVYTLELPAYPTAEELAGVQARGDVRTLAEQLEIPKVPAVVETLLQTAPDTPWGRLDVLRKKLLAEVTAEGSGTPVDVPPSKVVDLLEGSKTGSPYEIVAAEAMLARWAGVPSRIGFGFDGLNEEDGKLTVRPRNSAQWLEVWFDGYGWVPLIGQPQKAKTELDSDPNARFNPTILPSDDVAVEVYVVFELDDLKLLYERLRSQLMRVAPFAILAVASYVVWPAAAKSLRRWRRRRWAAARGPQAQVAVEYAEVRDLAIDLNIGDEIDTPLEWLHKVQPDEEHAELAWLAARALYGDMRDTVTEEDARIAEELASSVRRRLGRAQPLQTRVIAAISRTSLERPFSNELPNVRQLRIPRPRLPRVHLPRPRVPRLRARPLGGGR